MIYSSQLELETQDALKVNLQRNNVTKRQFGHC